MSSKDQPKWNWKPRIDDDDIERRCSSVNFVQHARSLGAREPVAIEKIRDDIRFALTGLHVNATYDPPSRNSMKNALRVLIKRAQELSDCLDALDYLSKFALESRLSEISNVEEPPLEEKLGQNARIPADTELENLCASLNLLIRGSELTIETLPDKLFRIHRKSEALSKFVEILAKIYETQTDTSAFSGFGTDRSNGQYTGPFIALVQTLLDEFCPDWTFSNSAIGENIRRTLGKR